MLVVEPEKRFTLKQISQHRWMQCRSSSINEDCCNTITAATPATTTASSTAIGCGSEIISDTQTANLDSIVVNHMLQLPNLTFDEIAESVHQNTFNHIYAIYNLLVDKLQAKRNEQLRLQHHASLGYTKYVFAQRVLKSKRKKKKILLIQFFWQPFFFIFSFLLSSLDREKQVLRREWWSVQKH